MISTIHKRALTHKNKRKLVRIKQCLNRLCTLYDIGTEMNYMPKVDTIDNLKDGYTIVVDCRHQNMSITQMLKLVLYLNKHFIHMYPELITLVDFFDDMTEYIQFLLFVNKFATNLIKIETQ